jgi:hypothetical protein
MAMQIITFLVVLFVAQVIKAETLISDEFLLRLRVLLRTGSERVAAAARRLPGGPPPGGEINCAPGKYYNDIASDGSTGCMTCPSNTYSIGGSALLCTECPTGMTSLSGSSLESDCTTPAIVCAAGEYYIDIDGSTVCMKCPSNTYSIGGSVSSCTECPSGSTSPSGSSLESACIATEDPSSTPSSSPIASASLESSPSWTPFSTPKETPSQSPTPTPTPSPTPSPGSSLSSTPSPTPAPSASPAIIKLGVKLPAVFNDNGEPVASLSDDAISGFLAAMASSLGIDDASALTFDHLEPVYEEQRLRAASDVDPAKVDNSNLVAILPRVLKSVLVGMTVYFNIAVATALEAFGGSTTSIADSLSSAISTASSSGKLSAALAAQPGLVASLGVTREFLFSSNITVTAAVYIAAGSPSPAPSPSTIPQSILNFTPIPSHEAGAIVGIVFGVLSVVVALGIAGYIAYVKKKKADMEKSVSMDNFAPALHIRSEHVEI